MIKYVVRILLSCLLLVYVSFKVDWQVISSAFFEINFPFYVFSTIVAITGGYFIAGKYYYLLKGTELSLSVRRLLIIQFISRFYALFLPTALGPEAVRWYKVTRKKKGKSFFLVATVYERLLFLLFLLAAGMIPLFYYMEHPQLSLLRVRILPLVLVCVAAIFAVLLYLLWPRCQAIVNEIVKKGLGIKVGGRIDQLLENFYLRDRSLTMLWRLLVLTLCWQLMFVVWIYFLFAAMNLDFGLLEAAWMGSLVLLLQVLPVTFAGLGVREGAYAYLFTLHGLPAEQGVVIGVLYFTQMLILAGIGAVLNLFEK